MLLNEHVYFDSKYNVYARACVCTRVYDYCFRVYVCRLQGVCAEQYEVVGTAAVAFGVIRAHLAFVSGGGRNKNTYMYIFI